MARIQPARYPEHPETDEPGSGGRGRKAMRYAVPVAVAGVAAATITLVPALADTGSPSLPSLTAQQLLTKMAAADTRTVSGSVRITTDLGLPAVLSGGAAGSLFSGAAGGHDGHGRGADKDSAAAPQAQLTKLLIGTHTLHVAADGPDRQKVSLLEPAAEYSLIHNGAQVWAYDSATNSVYHATAPEGRTGRAEGGKLPEDFPTTPQAAAQQVLTAAGGTASFKVDGTARVAGHTAYELVVTPRHADVTTVGAIRIAVDAKTGVPLKFTLTSASGGKAVVDIGFTKVSFGKPSAGTFTFTPPKGAKVTEADTRGRPADDAATKDLKGTRVPEGFAGRPTEHTVIGSGWDSIAVVKTGGLPQGAEKNGRDRGPESLLNSFGTHVSGAFGSGTVFHTRLVNALLTDNGTLYAGAVTQSALTDAANSAAK